MLKYTHLLNIFQFILSRDKIINKNDAENTNMFQKFRQQYNIPIIKKHRKETPADPFYKDVPTFSEFLAYVIDTPISAYNEHWRPYHLTCTPCHINYSVVMKLESLEDDAEILVLTTGLPELRPNKSHITTITEESRLRNDVNYLVEGEKDSVKWNYTNYYFAQISKATLFKLYEHLRIDFEMFGYDISPFIEIAIDGE